MEKTYELLIIGAGPAGITAAIYAARKRMDFLVISKDIGGQAAWSGDVENYTGYQFVSGIDLTEKFKEHIAAYKTEVKKPEEAKEIIKENHLIKVRTDKSEYSAQTVIIASGKRSKQLNVKGEEKYRNKGLTYCATCDGPLFSDKDVAVVGGGNAGLDAALQLEKIAKHIYLIESADSLTADQILQDKIKASSKVDIYTKSQIKEIIGEKLVTGIRISNNNAEKVLGVEGIFIEIGLIPNSEFADILEKNKKGEIKVDSYNHTNIEGIFAAGDVTDVPEKQIIIAAGEGSKAMLSAFKYLSRKQ